MAPKPVPIACTLEGGEARRRWERWASLNRWLTETRRAEGELLLRYAHSEAVHGLLPHLVQAERQCCAFVDWELEEDGPDLVLRVSGEELGVEAIAVGLGLEDQR